MTIPGLNPQPRSPGNSLPVLEDVCRGRLEREVEEGGCDFWDHEANYEGWRRVSTECEEAGTLRGAKEETPEHELGSYPLRNMAQNSTLQE